MGRLREQERTTTESECARTHVSACMSLCVCVCVVYIYIHVLGIDSISGNNSLEPCVWEGEPRGMISKKPCSL